METLETITYKGYDINIHPDYYADDPREWSNLSKLVLFHNGYDFPNELNIDHNDFNDWEDMEAFIEREYNPVYMRRVSMYEHGGIALKLGAPTCSWDSGYIGFILVTEEDAQKEFGSDYDIENVKNILHGEFKLYEHYVEGSVYSYTIELDDDHDALSGFYGYDHVESGLLYEAESMIDHHIEQQAKNRNNRLKDFIRNNVPFHVRQMELA